jgi:hypothetical protein
MRRRLLLAVLLVAGCAGDDSRSDAAAHSAAEVIAAFKESGLDVGAERDDGCGPSEGEQEELGITVYECSEGRFRVGEGPRPSDLLVPKPPGPATFSVLLYPTTADAASAVEGRSRYESPVSGETVILLRRANVVVLHEEKGAPQAAIVEALDRLTAEESAGRRPGEIG